MFFSFGYLDNQTSQTRDFSLYSIFLFFRKNKHEQPMAEICVECMKKKTELYLARAKDIFDEKTVIKWKVILIPLLQILLILVKDRCRRKSTVCRFRVPLSASSGTHNKLF